ncbi:MAG: hypothetical protein JOY80_11430 [Candidatus Dormibacteraeota bacterium]|nr:hypothetical protein [Candidatus Dormibacteraeota bacterium]
MDWEWVFGLDLLAIGVVAIVAGVVGAGAFLAALVWLVGAREFFGGVIPDAWFIRRGIYNRRLYTGFIVLHLIVIASGLLLLARTVV